ncbi:hypothetical protein [Ochrobactrum sp. Marseille-Q0166]|uniref:hypothetical protein n=1 Tax=Ochrobactrum sp. Marseille-Q0166 TaxID=2761105 RepID=UPI0016561F14|nr:hypothetical protein [Ochrobactrum sp. Marseille-Q0166]MBC8719585.1 hypothetical protein [Ochrobactrum sp. Marseille-Q0166]
MNEEHNYRYTKSMFERTLAPQQVLDDSFGRFPDYMNLIADVFSFEHPPLKTIITRFCDSSSLRAALDQAGQTITNSDLPEQTKTEVLQLLHDEQNMLSFSQVAKSSVIKI